MFADVAQNYRAYDETCLLTTQHALAAATSIAVTTISLMGSGLLLSLPGVNASQVLPGLMIGAFGVPASAFLSFRTACISRKNQSAYDSLIKANQIALSHLYGNTKAELEKNPQENKETLKEKIIQKTAFRMNQELTNRNWPCFAQMHFLKELQGKYPQNDPMYLVAEKATFLIGQPACFKL